jgi:hypothetical protein
MQCTVFCNMVTQSWRSDLFLLECSTITLFMHIFKCDRGLHSKQFVNFKTSLMMVQCWRGNVAGLRLCISRRTFMLWRVALQRIPSNSIRKAAAQLAISRRSVQRILKSDLNLYRYKMTVLPKLTIRNKHQRMASSEWAQNNDVSLSDVQLVFWWGTLPLGWCG